MDTTQYFYRNIIFSKRGNAISLIDINDPDKGGQILESWFGVVIQLADGQHTIDELIKNFLAKYKGNPPSNLKQTILSVIERLADSNFIVLTKESTKLPYYLSLPYEDLDIEKAKQILAKDRADIIK